MTFYMLIPKREPFVNVASGNSYFSIYQNEAYTSPQQIDDAVDALRITLDDKDDMLHMRRCYQFPNKTVQTMKSDLTTAYNHPVEGGMYVTDFEMITCSFKDVESKIVCEIQKFYETNLCKSNATLSCSQFPNSVTDMNNWKEETAKCPQISNANKNTPSSRIELSCDAKLQGPIYVLLFQAPYYRNDNQEPITLQFTMDAYGFLPFNSKRNVPDDDAPIYYYAQIMFARYNKMGMLSQIDFMRDKFMPELDRTNFSKEKQCFLMTKNNRERIHLPGGCGSTDGTPYVATCLGPATPGVRDSKNTRSSYGILYELNPQYHVLSSFINMQPASIPSEPGCGTFSSRKYREAYPDALKQSKKEPLEHWVTEGIEKGFLGFLEGDNQPNGGLWDGPKYVVQNRVRNVDALNHLKTIGWKSNATVCLKNPV